MTRIYAALSDLPAQYQDDPNAEDLIRRASNLVTSAIANGRFDTDAWGMPVGDYLTAARDATVIQVSTWLSTGVNPVTGYAGKGTASRITAKGSNGSSVSYAADAAAERYLNTLAEGVELTMSALMPLDAEGMLDVWLRGAYGAAGRLYAPRWQPVSLEWVEEGPLPILSGYVNAQRDEGVVRVQVRAVRNGDGSHTGSALLPEWAWPAGNISEALAPGFVVTVDSTTGILTATGLIGTDYVEGLMLWEASRG